MKSSSMLLNKLLMSLPKNGFKGVILLGIIGLCSSLTVAQSLQTYQEKAAQKNPQLRATYFEYLASLEQITQVGALPDPELSFAWFILPVETRLGPQQARISYTQMFPWFGSLKDNQTSQSLAAKARFEHFRDTRNQLFYQMEVLWAQLYETSEKLRLANENLEVVNTLVNVSLRKYETGLVPQVDVLRAQIEQEDLKTNIALLEDELDVQKSAFNTLRNVPLDADILLPTSLDVSGDLFSDEVEFRQRVKTNNPDINRLRLLEEQANSELEIASNRAKPGFGVGFDYIATGERPDIPALIDNGRDALIARVNIKIPLFRSKNRAVHQQAMNNWSASKERLSDRENELEQLVYRVIRDYEDAQRRYTLYDQQQIQRLEQAVRIMLQSYATDNSDFEEILRLQRKLFEYELQRIKAKTDQKTVSAFLNYLSGTHNITPQEINY